MLGIFGGNFYGPVLELSAVKISRGSYRIFIAEKALYRAGIVQGKGFSYMGLSGCTDAEVQWIAHRHTCFCVYKSTIDCTSAYMFFCIHKYNILYIGIHVFLYTIIVLVYTCFLTYRKAKEKAGLSLCPAIGCKPAC